MTRPEPGAKTRVAAAIFLALLLLAGVLWGASFPFQKDWFWRAIYHEQHQRAKTLLFINPSLVHLKKGQHTPLSIAIWNDDAPMTSLLLERGADASGNDGENAFFKFCYAGERLDILELLLERGLSPSWAAADALRNGNAEMVKLALEHGFSAETTLLASVAILLRDDALAKLALAREPRLGATKLRPAINEGHREMMKLAIARGANLDILGPEKRQQAERLIAEE
jgi:ankyrin repeat protein